MTSITRNLPWPIPDIGVPVIGQTCYTSLVENLNLVSDPTCVKYALSKGLGLGIVVGSAVMKVPQALLIVRARSARGLSLSAYLLETLSYAITTAYGARAAFPFSTYGESAFLTAQNVLINFLILLYSPTPTPSSSFALLAAGTALTGGLLFSLPRSVLSLLQASTLPLSVFSKLPQIRQNARMRSTGQLSLVAVLAQIFGCLARLFTTATEVGEGGGILAASFAVALVLNLWLGWQMYIYWGRDAAPGVHVKERDIAMMELPTQERVDIVVQPQSPSPLSSSMSTTVSAGYASPPVSRTGSPVPRAAPSTPGRKWSRKLD